MAYRKITDIRDTIGMRAVFYARVSTAEEEQLNAIELQIEENRGCIKDHGWKLVGEYIDRSKSGTMVKGRDDYQRLYEDLYEDLFDIVVIKDQERLQRNTLDWYLFINRVVQTGKLLFMYMDGKFYSPDDALITGVRAIIAEEFSRNLSKKLHNYHDHRIEKARQGQEIALQGSGNVYGWDKKDGKYYINPEQAKIRRLMCEGIMARKGSTLIAKELNDAGYRNTVGKPWKPMDIPKFVYDCKNVGTMIINKERHDFESKQTIKLPKEEWVYVENALPPIVTQEEWDLICKIHEERVVATGSDRRGKKTSGYSFSGKLVCGICGAPYWRKQRVSKDEYWVCSTKQTKGRRTRKRDSTMGKAGEINPLGCDNENISYNSLMEIMGVVSERLQANTDTIKQDMINWLTKLRKQLLEANGGHTEADLQRELSRKSKLLDAYLDGILNKQEYQKKAEELDEKIIQLKAETEKNKANSGDIAEIDKVLANIDEEVARYVDGNEKLKVEYLLEHLEQVQIFPDKVIVIVPILSEGIVVEKTQYVSREKLCRQENEVLREQAMQDSFTKLLNRGALEKHVCEALQERGGDEEDAFILLDVDNFKQINDIYGHGVGDMILMRMAGILNEVFGDHSCIGRMGGDEFAVFLRDIGDRREIEEKIQKLLTEVRAEKERMHLSKEPTASVGVAFVPESGSTFVDVYRAADQALYHVKNSTKNGMAFYDFV